MSDLAPADLIVACRSVSPEALASALYNANDPQLLAMLAEALESASHHLAFYPHQEVIAEADALLIEVLRWPIADILREAEHPMTVQRFADLRDLNYEDAQGILDHLVATDADAATRLVESGVNPNFTGEQAQVTRCIEALLTAGGVPTRASIRSYALGIARQAMRDGDTDEPIITHPTLPARIMSPSPVTSVFSWLNRMDATPAGPDFIDERIAYLASARKAAESAARIEHRAVEVREHLRTLGRNSAPYPFSSYTGGDPQDLRMVV